MTSNSLTIFEQLKQKTESDKDYWSARKLSKTLEYSDFRNFELVIKKAKEACKNSNQSIKNHFVDITEMVEIGSNTSRPIKDILLSRYACYLVMQNADPTKEVVALGQTYFAIQTRKQEVQEQHSEDHNRLFLRGEMTIHNKRLSESASKAGVKNYGLFTNYGYKGLYAGLTMQDIHKLKKLKKSQKILDHMSSEELAANLFRATQADAKLRREQIHGEANANNTHFKVGQKVRQTIKELGGTMPEKLPVSENITLTKKRTRMTPQKLQST